jgi:hypothetical protein
MVSPGQQGPVHPRTIRKGSDPVVGHVGRYPGVYDNLLIAVGFILNAAIIYYAWTWS